MTYLTPTFLFTSILQNGQACTTSSVHSTSHFPLEIWGLPQFCPCHSCFLVCLLHFSLSGSSHALVGIILTGLPSHGLLFICHTQVQFVRWFFVNHWALLVSLYSLLLIHSFKNTFSSIKLDKNTFWISLCISAEPWGYMVTRTVWFLIGLKCN